MDKLTRGRTFKIEDKPIDWIIRIKWKLHIYHTPQNDEYKLSELQNIIDNFNKTLISNNLIDNNIKKKKKRY